MVTTNYLWWFAGWYISVIPALLICYVWYFWGWCSTASGVSISSSDPCQIFTTCFEDTEVIWSSFLKWRELTSAIDVAASREPHRHQHDLLIYEPFVSERCPHAIMTVIGIYDIYDDSNLGLRESEHKLHVCLRKCCKSDEQKPFGIAKGLQHGFQVFKCFQLWSLIICSAGPAGHVYKKSAGLPNQLRRCHQRMWVPWFQSHTLQRAKNM